MIPIGMPPFLAPFAAPFVTPRLRGTTDCHDNFGYYFLKSMIRHAVVSSGTGIGCAIESKLVCITDA
jgi:hypothetical protein